MKKKAIIIVMLVLTSLCLTINTAVAGAPLTVYGDVYDEDGNLTEPSAAMALNKRTGETLDGEVWSGYTEYQIQLGNMPGGWSVGDVINVTITKLDKTTSDEFTIPDDIMEQGSVINLDMHFKAEKKPIPGFELIALLGAIAIGCIILKRGRKK